MQVDCAFSMHQRQQQHGLLVCKSFRASSFSHINGHYFHFCAQAADLIPGFLTGSIPFHEGLDAVKLPAPYIPLSALQRATATSASALAALSPSPSATVEQERPIDSATLAALTVASLAGSSGGPSVQTLQAAPKLPSLVEIASQINANTAQAQSYLQPVGKAQAGR
jgi:hypothetical protein